MAAVKVTVDALKKLSKPVTTPEEIAQVRKGKLQRSNVSYIVDFLKLLTCNVVFCDVVEEFILFVHLACFKMAVEVLHSLMKIGSSQRKHLVVVLPVFVL